ncbi:MAG: restriction endonuclease subunit S [archaeon]
MKKVSDLFFVNYGSSLELNRLKRDSNGINFVSRTAKNNGVSAKVKQLPDVDPIPSGTISVATSGSIMESFLQLHPYYSGYHLFYLIPKNPMSNELMLYYCACLKANKFKYSFGRQANSTLKDLLIPSEDEIPDWIEDFSIRKYAKELITNKFNFETRKLNASHLNSNNNLIPLSDLFDTFNGVPTTGLKRLSKKKDNSYVPLIRPSYRQNTSIGGYVSKNHIDPKFVFPKGTLYVSTNGQGSHTYTYVSVSEFVPNSDVTVLIPKREMGLSEKIYYAQCITKNRYRFSYGRKPKGDRLNSIMLPEHPPKSILIYDVGQIKTKFLNVINML